VGSMSFEATVTFDAQGNDAKVALMIEAQTGGIFKMAEGLEGNQMEKQVSTDLAGLKRVKEGGTK